jgi:aldose sugar dehydrogenase
MPGGSLWIAAVALIALQAAPQPACAPAPRPSPPSPGPGPAPVPTETFTAADGTRFGVQVYLTGLEVPWSLAFAPDGRLFLTERTGRVRIVQNGQLLAQPALTVEDVWAQGEAGLLGLALHPRFAENRFVYLFYTAAEGATPVNRIVRYRELNNALGERAVILDRVPAAIIHDGGRLRFGPDGHLYLAMGDVAVPARAQSLGSLAGKILRMTDDGRTPGDNPFNSPVWSWGHRNPQGLDWHPETGDLWASEHGQVGNDELNLIVRGGNYGWPVIEGGQALPDMIAPVLFFSPSIAPSGLSFYTGTAIPGFRNDVFFTALAGMHLGRVRLDPAAPRQVLAHEALLRGRYGRLRDVITGPDGALYVSTSNRDGRATPSADDDRVLRIVAAP